jgi:hypothetical protein
MAYYRSFLRFAQQFANARKTAFGGNEIGLP